MNRKKIPMKCFLLYRTAATLQTMHTNVRDNNLCVKFIYTYLYKLKNAELRRCFKILFKIWMKYRSWLRCTNVSIMSPAFAICSEFAYEREAPQWMKRKRFNLCCMHLLKFMYERALSGILGLYFSLALAASQSLQRNWNSLFCACGKSGGWSLWWNKAYIHRIYHLGVFLFMALKSGINERNILKEFSMSRAFSSWFVWQALLLRDGFVSYLRASNLKLASHFCSHKLEAHAVECAFCSVVAVLSPFRISISCASCLLIETQVLHAIPAALYFQTVHFQLHWNEIKSFIVARKNRFNFNILITTLLRLEPFARCFLECSAKS